MISAVCGWSFLLEAVANESFDLVSYSFLIIFHWERVGNIVLGRQSHLVVFRVFRYRFWSWAFRARRRNLSRLGSDSAVVFETSCSMPIIMDVFQMVAGQECSSCSGSPFVALLMVPLRV